MPTYKVVYKSTNTWTGYIEATDEQDAVNKVTYPIVTNDEGNQVIGTGGQDASWEMHDRTYTTGVNSITPVSTGTENTNVPTAVEPSI